MLTAGDALRMMQVGGVDRTGFADMADAMGTPGADLMEARRIAAAQDAERNMFADLLESMMMSTTPGMGEIGAEMTPPLNAEEIIQTVAESATDSRAAMGGAKPGRGTSVTPRTSSIPKIDTRRPGGMGVSPKTPKIGAVPKPPTGILSTILGLGKYANPLSAFFGTLLSPTPAGEGSDIVPGMEEYATMQDFNDGGRVGMQLGGGIMNNLLGSPQVQSMIQQYQQPTFDFSQVASPSIPQPAVAPATPPQAYTPFVSTMPLYDPSTLGTGLPSTAGMADPFFVYDPYSPVGAFDAPPASTGPTPLTQDKIMETFKNLDKFTLAKQEEKAEAAEKAKKQTKRGGGGSQEDRARNKARRDAMTERARDARNRGRGFSGRGTSDPGGQAARGA
jgi:hypothetical protein